MKRKLLMALLFSFALYGVVKAQDEQVTDSVLETATIAPPAPISSLYAKDKADDHGHGIVLEWKLSPDDGAGANSVVKYEIFRWVPFARDRIEIVKEQLRAVTDSFLTTDGDTEVLGKRREALKEQFAKMKDGMSVEYAAFPNGGEFRLVGSALLGVTSYENVGNKDELSPDYLPDFTDLYYRVDAVTLDSTIRTASEIFGPVRSSGQWFNSGRKPVAVAVLIFGFLTLFFVNKAKSGSDLYVRPLAGIEAVDDAIGRATEMGRPILYVLGLGSAADIATIASFTILGRVAKRVAEYQTKLLVPTYDPIVMSVAQEVVKSSYMDAGRPDDYDEDIVHFVTQSQFAYVAAVNGIMLRELPATNVYMGKFFAESLILAETGAVAGSIQIAGTDEIAQIPFFIVACDFTLIGEELYAASAYLGKEPILLGSLKAQDWAKAAVVIFAIVGLLSANLGWDYFVELFKVAN